MNEPSNVAAFPRRPDPAPARGWRPGRRLIAWTLVVVGAGALWAAQQTQAGGQGFPARVEQVQARVGLAEGTFLERGWRPLRAERPGEDCVGLGAVQRLWWTCADGTGATASVTMAIRPDARGARDRIRRDGARRFIEVIAPDAPAAERRRLEAALLSGRDGMVVTRGAVLRVVSGEVWGVQAWPQGR